VGNEELKKRRESGSQASTMVVRVRSLSMIGALTCSSLWVGGYWCSIKKYVVVQLRRRVAS